jgi:hydroxymethylglutaryl-CoA reductase
VGFGGVERDSEKELDDMESDSAGAGKRLARRDGAASPQSDGGAKAHPTRRAPEVPGEIAPERSVERDSGERDAPVSSRLPGFYELPISERLKTAQRFAGLGDLDALGLGGGVGGGSQPLSGELIDVFIENGVGAFGLPLGVATNVRVNGVDRLVPMAVEETSVVAAASHGSKLARHGGGFTAVSSAPIMTGQIQLLIDPDRTSGCDFDALLTERRESLLQYANRGNERLIERGGGAVDLTWRYIAPIKSLVIHLHVDTRDAMGANIVNTMCEQLSSVLAGMFPCEVGLRILTNLSDRRLCKASCRVPARAFDTPEFDGRQVVDRIVMAYQFAAHDVYRATTNNKGVMNGIDPVLIATGNDWRAVEAGAHAWAARSGVYQPLAVWEKNPAGDLVGTLELPMAVGVVGGVTKLHPTARAALKLLGSPSGTELGEIVTSVGLAQNLSALRALASEGIQRGHMSLHRRNLDLLDRQGGGAPGSEDETPRPFGRKGATRE